MRRRATYSDSQSYDVRAAGELLLYGPRTATAVSLAVSIRTGMQADSEHAQLELVERIRELRSQGIARTDAMAVIRKTNPELFERAYPWHVLERTGVRSIREAAEADTREFLEAAYKGKFAFAPCRTPLDAMRKYRNRQLAA